MSHTVIASKKWDSAMCGGDVLSHLFDGESQRTVTIFVSLQAGQMCCFACLLCVQPLKESTVRRVRYKNRFEGCVACLIVILCTTDRDLVQRYSATPYHGRLAARVQTMVAPRIVARSINKPLQICSRGLSQLSDAVRIVEVCNIFSETTRNCVN